MTKHKLTTLILLNFNTKKYIYLFTLYQNINIFFFNNNLMLKILKIFILKFKKQIEQYRINNNSLFMNRWFKFGRSDKLKQKLNKLISSKRFNFNYSFNPNLNKSFLLNNEFLSVSIIEITNIITSVGFSKKNIIFLTQPFLTQESYLLNLHCLGTTEAQRLNNKLKHFLFLNKHDKLSRLANFCFLLSPSEVNYKYLSYYRNRYVPVIGVSTTKNLNVKYDKTIFMSYISESQVYAFMSFVLINYIAGKNLSVYYTSQLYYTQVIWFTYRKLNLYKKIFYEQK